MEFDIKMKKLWSFLIHVLFHKTYFRCYLIQRQKKLTINNYKMLLLGQNSKVCLERKATLHEKIIEGYKVIM